MAGSERSGRRDFLTQVGVAAGAVAIAAPQRALARPETGLPDSGGASVLGLSPAQRIGRWTIVAVHAVRFGAVPVVMVEDSGARFQLDVLRRERRERHPSAAYSVPLA